MGLSQISTNTVTSAVSSVVLTGIDSDVVICTYHNLQGSVNDKYPQLRFTNSGTANSTSNYDWAAKKLKTYSSFQNQSGENQTLIRLADEKLGDQFQETGQGIITIFNATNSSEYTLMTIENVNRDGGGNLMSSTGSFMLTEASVVDGVEFFIDSSNIVSGTFTLYRLT